MQACVIVLMNGSHHVHTSPSGLNVRVGSMTPTNSSVKLSHFLANTSARYEGIHRGRTGGRTWHSIVAGFVNSPPVTALRLRGAKAGSSLKGVSKSLTVRL
jgi:hypothetical protein